MDEAIVQTELKGHVTVLTMNRRPHNLMGPTLYRALLDEFDAADVMWTFLAPMHPRFLGDPREDVASNPRLASWFADAVTEGFIGLEQTPAAFREHPRILAMQTAAPKPAKATKPRAVDLDGDDWG